MTDRFRFDLIELIGQIEYKDWMLQLSTDGDGRLYIRWQWYAKCAKEGTSQLVSGRRWYLSNRMCKSEVVQTALLAALTAEEHETREHFRYRGKRVFNPHIDVDAMLKICDEEAVRDDI